MRKSACLTLAAAATSLALASGGPAQARTGAVSAASTTTATTAASSAEIRYAWLKSCRKGHDDWVACGSWALHLTNGKQIVLKDARIHAVDRKGKVDKESLPELQVGSDGKSVAYFRKSDNKLVVRDLTTGKVRPLPGAAARLPKGVGMDEVLVTVAPGGKVVTVDYDNPKRPVLVVDLATGKVSKIRGDVDVKGFSPDAEHLLATRETSENTTQFLVYDRSGRQTAGRVVPQVVANNEPVALADDGSTLALVILTSSGKQRLRTYDLTDDSVSEAVDVKAPANETATILRWNADGGLTMWNDLLNNKQEVVGFTVRKLDPDTGRTTKIDAYKPPANNWTMWRPGE